MYIFLQQILLIHHHIHIILMDLYLLLIHIFLNQILIHQLNMVQLHIFELHNVYHFINLKDFLSKISLFLDNLPMVSQCMFEFFLLVLFKNIVGIMNIVLVTSMLMEKNYNHQQMIISLSLNSYRVNFYELMYEYLDNSLFFGINAFLLKYLYLQEYLSNIHPNLLLIYLFVLANLNHMRRLILLDIEWL